MRILFKRLTYEIDTVEELQLQIQKEEIEGWDVKEQGEIERIAVTDKLYCTVNYRLWE